MASADSSPGECVVRIIEQFTAAKSGVDAQNEDRIFVTDSFAVVADGATSLRPARRVPSPGSLVADVICRQIQDIEPDWDAARSIASLSNAVKAAAGQGRQLAASVVIYSRARREIWSVGDCRYLAGNSRFEPAYALESLLKQLRAFVIAAELAAGNSVDSLRSGDKGREAIKPFLRRQKSFANAEYPSPWAYGVINGRHVPPRFIHVFDVPACVDEIVLASDGYPSIEPTLARSEEALSRLVSQDPLCYRLHMATKGVPPGATAFDDRAYLRLHLEPIQVR